jgi:hypothetical protein
MLGMPVGSITTVEHMREAAVQLHKLGCTHVLVKGGHLGDDAAAVDVLYDGQRRLVLHELGGYYYVLIVVSCPRACLSARCRLPPAKHQHIFIPQ